MNKIIGILAHVDAGKTTFSEHILYHCKSIRTLGKVDNKNSFLDTDEIEKKRGITIFSNQAVFEYNNNNYFLVDTPGHVDFSSEMERSLQILDYAVIIINYFDGLQSHTETIWKLLIKNKIPVFLFINKTEKDTVNISNIIKQLKDKLSDNIIYINKNINNNELDNNFIEKTAELDDILFQKYIDNKYNRLFWIERIKKLIKNNKLFICYSGSALYDIGIKEFLDDFDMLTYTDYDNYINDKLYAKVYKIKYDEQNNRLLFLKLLKGKLKIKDKIKDNKVEQIKIYNGNKYKNVSEVSAGNLCAVTGLHNFYIGDEIGLCDKKTNYKTTPMLSAKIIYDEKTNYKDIYNCFKILEDEDPLLNVKWNETLHELQINVMGKIHMEILKELILNRFNININFGKCEILYKETINAPVIGYGHFEPLKHYAEVHLKLSPAERNSGIIFKNKCSSDLLDINYQNLIKTHIFEKTHKGILTGYPVTDIEITLLTGRSHNKHTEGGDFRQAVYRAIRQGLEQAENIILEPIYNFEIEVETEYIGKVMSDIKKMNGMFESPNIKDNIAVINGKVPVSDSIDYPIELISFTKGKGKINFEYGGYEKCHNQNEVIQKINYNKNNDTENTSSSVFCSHGKGFIVEWNEVKNYIHCK